MSELLRATGLVSGYGRIEALHGVDVSVDAGQAVTVIGPNGAGKSTLLRTLAGLSRPWRDPASLVLGGDDEGAEGDGRDLAGHDTGQGREQRVEVRSRGVGRPGQCGERRGDHGQGQQGAAQRAQGEHLERLGAEDGREVHGQASLGCAANSVSAAVRSR